MSDDIVGIIPDDNLDDESQNLGLVAEGLVDDEDLVNIDDIDVLSEDAAHVAVEEDFLFEEDDTLGSVKKKRIIDDEESDELSEETFDDDDDDDDDFLTDEDDEARYNYRAEEDPLDEGY